jgi:hypothetical protein
MSGSFSAALRGMTIAVGFTVCARSAASAQEHETVAPRSRIRVTSESNKLFNQLGIVSSVRGDSIVLTSDQANRSWTLALTELDRLEVSTGPHRQTAKGLGIGLLGGGAVSTLLGVAACEDGFVLTKGECVGGAAILGAVAGLVIGTIVGASTRSEGWRRIEQPKSAKVGLRALASGRIGIGIVVGF